MRRPSKSGEPSSKVTFRDSGLSPSDLSVNCPRTPLSFIPSSTCMANPRTSWAPAVSLSPPSSNAVIRYRSTSHNGDCLPGVSGTFRRAASSCTSYRNKFNRAPLGTPPLDPGSGREMVTFALGVVPVSTLVRTSLRRRLTLPIAVPVSLSAINVPRSPIQVLADQGSWQRRGRSGWSGAPCFLPANCPERRWGVALDDHLYLADRHVDHWLRWWFPRGNRGRRMYPACGGRRPIRFLAQPSANRLRDCEFAAPRLLRGTPAIIQQERLRTHHGFQSLAFHFPARFSTGCGLLNHRTWFPSPICRRRGRLLRLRSFLAIRPRPGSGAGSGVRGCRGTSHFDSVLSRRRHETVRLGRFQGRSHRSRDDLRPPRQGRRRMARVAQFPHFWRGRPREFPGCGRLRYWPFLVDFLINSRSARRKSEVGWRPQFGACLARELDQVAAHSSPPSMHAK